MMLSCHLVVVTMCWFRCLISVVGDLRVNLESGSKSGSVAKTLAGLTKRRIPSTREPRMTLIFLVASCFVALDLIPGVLV